MKNFVINFLLDNNKASFFLIILLIFLNLFLELIGLSLFIPLIKIILNKETYSQYLGNFFNYDFETNYSYLDFLKIILIIIFFTFLIKNALLLFSTIVQNKFFQKYHLNITTKLFNNYLHKEFKFFTDTNCSMILRNLRNETSGSVIFLQSAIIFFTEILIFIGILTFLLFKSPGSTLLIFFIIAPFVLIYFLLTKNILIRLGKSRIDLDGLINKNFLETINAIKEIKLYSKEKIFEKYSYKNLKKIFNIQIFFTILSNIPRLLLEILIIFSLLIVIYLSESKILSTGFDNSFEALSLLVLASARILPSVSKILMSVQNIRFKLPSIKLIMDEINILNENVNPINKEKNQHRDYNLLLITSDMFKISITGLSFYYNNINNKIFDKVNLELNSNNIYGFYGSTGSGKTTLVDLIAAFYTPTEGQINLNNNINVSKNIGIWRKNFGYVSQKTILIDDTIEKNISLELDEKKIDANKIKKALVDSELEEFVSSLELKSKTIVGPNGAKLSGGQIQRIGIARALYQNAKIIIFDEATNALDFKTENKILKMIENLKKGKIILLISHNQNTMKFCDHIYQVKKNYIIKERKIH